MSDFASSYKNFVRGGSKPKTRANPAAEWAKLKREALKRGDSMNLRGKNR